MTTQFYAIAKQLALAGFASAILTGAALAQATSPPNPAPAIAPVVPPAPSNAPVADAAKPGERTVNSIAPEKTPLGCEWKSTSAAVGGAGLVFDSATDQRKSWQPVGGEISFAIRSFGEFAKTVRPIVCFRWRSVEKNETSVPAKIDRAELSSDSKTLTLTVTIPNLGPSKNSHVRAIHLVPIADVLIRIPHDGQEPIDIHTALGITSPSFAFILAIVVGALAFGWLLIIVRKKVAPTEPKANPFLTVISGSSGYASLSQFQIVVWTFVVLLSAVYVMALSGELIQITTGTLVLLGISGATTVASTINSNSEPASPTPATPPPPLPPHPKPLWSDLITNSVLVGPPDAQSWKTEIDVTRVQMLLFTLITAAFVVLQVMSTYVIPEIPNGFQILMGISNAVYMGKKITQ